MKSLYYRQILFIILLFFAFLIVIAALIFSGTASATTVRYHFRDQFGGKKELKRYINTDINFSRHKQVRADILVIDGSLSIDGEIYGDVIAIWSEVKIKDDGKIFGNIINYHSEIKTERDAQIAGDIINAKSHRINYLERHDIHGYNFPYHIFSSLESDDEEEIAEIDEDETISGDVIVLKKELEINGKIDGDLICLTGNIKIKDAATIDGHVINYDGDVDISEETLITGEIFNNTSGNTITSKKHIEIDDRKIQEDIEEKYIKRRMRKKSDVIRFLGDVVIEEDEVINGTVLVMRGTALIKGEVNGEVVSIFGDIELDSTGYVSGDVVSVGGKIYRNSGSQVCGDVVQTSWTGVKIDNDEQYVNKRSRSVRRKVKNDENLEKSGNRNHHNFEGDFETENFMFRYNRVEGLFVGLRLPKYGFDEFSRYQTSLYGHAGYGFQNKRGRYQVGLERRFYYTTIGAEAHDITDTEDDWIISTFENSLAAFFLKEDFHDYYRRIGASGYLTQNITPKFAITVGYHKDRFYNMGNETSWALFGKKKKFRANPHVDKIEMNSLRLNVSLDTRNDRKYPTQGWLVNLFGEFAGPDFNKEESGIDFDRFIFDVRRYQPIGYGENLDFRLRLGTGRGVLPLQYRYDLGGISTLRGYRYKEFQDGDRMILGNVEYRIYGPKVRLKELLFMNDLNLVIFADAGLVWNAEDNTAPEKSFEHLDWNDLKTSVGVGLSNYDGNVRLIFAQRLDDREKPVVIAFRIRRPF